jgi:hypothetical protein
MGIPCIVDSRRGGRVYFVLAPERNDIGQNLWSADVIAGSRERGEVDNHVSFLRIFREDMIKWHAAGLGSAR